MKSLAMVLPLLAVVAVSSCDQAKRAMAAARGKLESAKVPAQPGAAGGEVNSIYSGQVDTAAEGVRFRRDLAFPTVLKVNFSRVVEHVGTRVQRVTPMGPETTRLEGKFENVAAMERDAGRLLINIERNGRVVEAVEAEEEKAGGKKGKAAPPPPPPKPDPEIEGGLMRSKMEFRLGQNGWRMPEGGQRDFSDKMVEQSLAPGLNQIIINAGLTPRRQWFSSTRRWLNGDELTLEGDFLELLFPKGTTGKVTLVFEDQEAVGGHPCGRFSINGSIHLRNAPDLLGARTSGDVSFENGRVWCSVIHPLVLRSETRSIQTVESGQDGGPKMRIQGEISETLAIQWGE